MRNCERSCPVAGTSALKPRPCTTAARARIIAFPASLKPLARKPATKNPTSLTSRQSGILLAIGCVLSFGALLMPF